MKATIFVTDDDEVIRAAMTRHLTRNHHQVRSFDSGEELLKALDHDSPDLILLDLKMTGMTGIETLKHVRYKAPQALVILLTAYGTVQHAVESMRLGAYDFVIKSVDLSAVDPIVNRGLDYLKLRNRVVAETQDVNSRYAFQYLVANSVSMRDLVKKIHDLSQNLKTTVLLQGETGTGKEFVARVLHHNSPRSQAPFVGVNCTAIPKELFESEFFGHERGAFTGAIQRKLGLCEQAEGGTLFLDEIGDLDLSMQGKLLRVLQERSIKRLGGKLEIEVDFRLIAATNRDLDQKIAQGSFREDLFFRLNVVSLELPPLRHRIEDIMPLALQALVKHGREMGKDIVSIEPQAKNLLERYLYPGNIRQLHNIIERAVIFCRGKTLTSRDLPRELHERAKTPVSAVTKGEEQVIQVDMTLGKQTLAEIESFIIDKVIQLSGSNKSQAAKLLGLTRFALDRRLRKWGNE